DDRAVRALGHLADLHHLVRHHADQPVGRARDGLTALALRQLEVLGLRPEAVPSWTEVRQVVLHSPSGRTVELALPAGPGTHAVVARRRDLDAALVDLARGAGAEVLEGSALLGADRDEKGATVHLEGIGEVRARHVVGADGAWSPLRRAFGLGGAGYRGDWHALRQYVSGTEVGSRLHVLFDAGLLPGYAWAFPLPEGGANVGLGILRGGRVATGDTGPLWRALSSRAPLRDLLGPTAEADGPLRAWPIPAHLGAVPLTAGPVLFVGDAAAVTDPLTGEGIGQALLTGVLAAEAVVATAGGRAGDAAATYAASVRRELGLDHTFGHRLSGVLSSARVTRAGIRAVGATAWSRRNFARWMFEDYPRALVGTPRRWHRGVLSGPGAFATA
ncbi:MAG: hypothetical protein GEV08_25885, partial [Acidimicrobiia bacterium]|nr:hypothetical protein [Acidimicrobiia bacterium]